MMIYTLLRAVMICQACGLDKKRQISVEICRFLVRVKGLRTLTLRRRSRCGSFRPPQGLDSAHLAQKRFCVLKLERKQKARHKASLFVLVRVKGLEPSQSCPHKNLNLTRLPIPPNPHRLHNDTTLLSRCQEVSRKKFVFSKKKSEKKNGALSSGGKKRAENTKERKNEKKKDKKREGWAKKAANRLTKTDEIYYNT